MPQYVPSFVDIEGFQRFVDMADELTELQHPATQAHDMLDDTVLLASSLAMEAALALRDSLKSAARHGRHDAEAAAADLAARYPKGKGAKSGRKVTGNGEPEGAQAPKNA